MVTEDEMVGWHHRLNGHEFEQTLLAAAKLFQSCPTLWDPHGLQPTRLLHLWDFPGKSTGVGCHCLLLGDAEGQGSLTSCSPWDCKEPDMT